MSDGKVGGVHSVHCAERGVNVGVVQHVERGGVIQFVPHTHRQIY